MIEIQILYPHTVEPRFNEVPRDWGNLFVISKGSLYRTPPFNEFSGNYQNVRYTAEKLILERLRFTFTAYGKRQTSVENFSE